MTKEMIFEEFKKEFWTFTTKFNPPIDFPMNRVDSKNELADKPGIYVFLKNQKVVKVGRSFSNSRKRALEHIRDNTGGEMSQLKDDSDCHLLLFTLKNSNDLHWVAALEVFFERKLEPLIKSNRLA